MVLRVCCADGAILGVEWWSNYEGRTVVTHGLCERPECRAVFFGPDPDELVDRTREDRLERDEDQDGGYYDAR